jgi:hypothetical protein
MDNVKDSETRTLSHTQEQCTHAQLAYIPPSESISIPQDKLVTKAKSCNSSLFHYGKTEEISCQTTSDGTAPDSTRFRNHVLPRKPMEIICSTRVRLQQQRSRPCLVPPILSQIPLCKKKIPRHIKMSANA